MNEWWVLAIAMGSSTLMVLATVVIHYEVLRILSAWVQHMSIPPRPRVLVIMFGSFFGHTLEVWVYALGFYLLQGIPEMGSFGGEWQGTWLDYLYYSTTAYTSLGLGDVYPLGALRLVTGIEAVNGLLLIGWTASFTYLNMEKFWGMHIHKK